MANSSTKLPTHPFYKQLQADRLLNRALYNADVAYINTPEHLVKLPVEENKIDGERLYQLRQQHSWYDNRLADYVGQWISLVKQNELSVNAELFGDYKKFFQNIAGAKDPQTLQTFLLREILPILFVEGSPSILIDAPPRSDNPAELSSVNDEDYTPYCIAISPLALVYWERDAYTGAYQEAHIERNEYISDGEKGLQEVTVRYVYARISSSEIAVTRYRKLVADGQYQLIPGTRFLSLPFIPLVTLDSENWVSRTMQGLLVEHHNKRSQLNSILAQQGHASRWLKLNGGTRESVLDGSIFGVIALQPGEEYGQLDPTDPVALSREMGKVEERLKDCAFRRVREVQSSGAVESADTIQTAKEGLREAIETLTVQIVPFLNKAIEYAVYFMNDSEQFVEPAISVHLDSGVSDTQIMSAVASLPVAFPEQWNASQTLRDLAFNRVLSLKSLSLSDEDQAQIIAETSNATVRSDDDASR